ncbi:uncharacterized protein gask1a isoform X2 [Gouania willdenowi]|uniref:uncharacterized protein gask1a isoform X2 n=1 Tax=Gouania willdenowi TaxID=441366 RepID=UPI001054A235|nr:Golgi-associated kinase 1A isoform X2 [Gouania willdenowi]
MLPCTAWRVCSKLCCSQRWALLFSSFLLLFLTVFLRSITLPHPSPPSNIDRRSSRVLSSARELRSQPEAIRLPLAAAFRKPLLQFHRGVQRTGPDKRKSLHSLLPKQFRDCGDSIHEGRQTDTTRKKDTLKIKTSKRKETPNATRSTGHHKPSSLSEVTVNNTQPKHRIKATNHNAEVKAFTGRQTESLRSTDRKVHEIYARAKPKELKQAATKHLNIKRQHNVAENHSNKTHISKALHRFEFLTEKQSSGLCPSFREHDFLNTDHRKIRISRKTVPWLSDDDVLKMQLLAEGDVMSKARVAAHGQVLQVGLDPPTHQQRPVLMKQATHSERCKQGLCSLIKRSDDWFEVFAFHLDRVLGLNRSLPAVLRTFHSGLLPYRYVRSTPRPAVWWDPDIQHLADRDNDQNSVQLTWVQYQKMLQAHCGSETHLKSPPCVGVWHSEWGRLALFDFLLQVNDRLDRYCCGFTPDPAELCVENRLHSRCSSSEDLLLVHILVRNADPSRLVFIDNAGRPQQSTDNLNFRLVEGIDDSVGAIHLPMAPVLFNNLVAP